MSDVIHDVSSEEIESKPDRKLQMSTELLSKATQLFLQVASNPTIRNITTQAALQEAAKMVTAYDDKHGPGASKNSTKLLKEITIIVGGDESKAVAIVNALSKTVDLVSNSNPIPEASTFEPEVNVGGPIVCDNVTEPASEPTVSNEIDDEELREKARELASEVLHDNRYPFSPRDLDKAILEATAEDIKNKEAFILLVMRIANEEQRKADEEERIQRAAKSSIQRWEEGIKSQYEDVDRYVQRLLEEKYNLPEDMVGLFDVQLGTFALPGIVNKSGTMQQELLMDSYSNPVFAILRNIDSEQVAKAVQRSVDAMNGDVLSAQVNGMLITSNVVTGDTIDERREAILASANALPQFRGKNAPDNYKIWYVLTRSEAYSSNIPKNMTGKLYSKKDDAINHQARTEEYMSQGIPQAPAMDMAYRMSVQEVPEEEAKERGLLDSAGRVIGTIAAAPARCKKHVQDAMYEAMGEFGDEWKANQEAAKERKRKLKEQKAQQEFELAQKELELKTQMMAQQNAQRLSNNMRGNQGYGYGYGNPGYGNQGYGYNNQGYGRQGHRGYVNNGNFAPRIPFKVLCTIAHVIIGLLLWLFCGNVKGAVSAIGLTLSSIGMFRIGKDRYGIWLTIGGYALVLCALFLK